MLSTTLRSSLRRLRILSVHVRMASTSAGEDEVLLQTINGKGVITLNRPKALNSLNLNMIRKIYPQLKAWDEDSSTSLVIIKGAGEKAFCAGGDIKAVTDSGKAGGDYHINFFREEYILNHKIANMTKPFIALVNGISMGGGVGLSVHCPYRVASEKTMFAMPECGIGLFPDVGGGYALSRFQGELGVFLALIGQRLKGRDVLHSGYATHFIESTKMAELESSLLNMSSPSTQDVETLINKYHDECQLDKDKPFILSDVVNDIDRIFSGQSVEDICTSLEKDGSEWATKQLQILRKMSPTSLKISLRQLREAATMSLEDDLCMEYRISQGCMRANDFYEGVRAVLVDRDNNPKWKPATIEEVTDEIVEDHFRPVDNDLHL